MWYVLSERHILLFDLLLPQQVEQGRLVLGVGEPRGSRSCLKVRKRFGVVIVQHCSRTLSAWSWRVVKRGACCRVAQHVVVSRHVPPSRCFWRGFVGLSRHQQLLLCIRVEVLRVHGRACSLVHSKRAPQCALRGVGHLGPG